MPRLTRDDGAQLEYEVRLPHTGNPGEYLIFQHGMGGDRRQPQGYLTPTSAITLVSMDGRGHGDSSDITDTARCSFDAFADDVVALADTLGIERFAMGGISLGAAVATNVAIRYPDRVSALLLCRPAWLDTAQADPNRLAYSQIADLLDRHDTDEASARFQESDTYISVLHESASAAASLRHQITRPRAALNSQILRRFPSSTPEPNLDRWHSIDIPTLVIGHTDDPFHPWDIAETTADRIPGTRLVQVPSKDRDPTQFQSQINDAIHLFLGASQ